MKRIVTLAAVGLLSLNLMAQESEKKEEGFQFTTVKELPITAANK